MSNASLKEQLQAVAEKFDQPTQQRNNKPMHKPSPKQVEKPKWLEHAQYGVELLKAYFPLCFNPEKILPLKKGIKQDLVLRLSTLDKIVTDDKACMVKSLSYYVNTMSYHKVVVEGAVRVDLDGNPEGVVTAEEAKYSIERSQNKQKIKQQPSIS